MLGQIETAIYSFNYYFLFRWQSYAKHPPPTSPAGTTRPMARIADFSSPIRQEPSTSTVAKPANQDIKLVYGGELKRLPHTIKDTNKPAAGPGASRKTMIVHEPTGPATHRHRYRSPPTTAQQSGDGAATSQAFPCTNTCRPSTRPATYSAIFSAIATGPAEGKDLDAVAQTNQYGNMARPDPEVPESRLPPFNHVLESNWLTSVSRSRSEPR